jgi:hypothetical protein
MALLYRADLSPTKLELLAAWLPTRVWYPGPPGPELRRVASYRFDDPAGETGIETMLVRAGAGPVLQAPLTYRGAPLEGGDAWLVGTTEHSVLGRRWVYDACGDPVYAAVLADIIRTGAGQADEYIEDSGRLERREPSMSVRGSGAWDGGATAVDTVVRVEDGDPTLILTGTVELAVVRVLDDPAPPARPAPAARLSGTWHGRATDVVLARARAV